MEEQKEESLAPLAPTIVSTTHEEEKKDVESAQVKQEAESGPAELAEGSVGPSGKGEDDLEEEAARLRVEEELKETKKVIEGKDREMNQLQEEMKKQDEKMNEMQLMLAKLMQSMNGKDGSPPQGPETAST